MYEEDPPRTSVVRRRRVDPSFPKPNSDSPPVPGTHWSSPYITKHALEVWNEYHPGSQFWHVREAIQDGVHIPYGMAYNLLGRPEPDFIPADVFVLSPDRDAIFIIAPPHSDRGPLPVLVTCAILAQARVEDARRMYTPGTGGKRSVLDTSKFIGIREDHPDHSQEGMWYVRPSSGEIFRWSTSEWEVVRPTENRMASPPGQLKYMPLTLATWGGFDQVGKALAASKPVGWIRDPETGRTAWFYETSYEGKDRLLAIHQEGETHAGEVGIWPDRIDDLIQDVLDCPKGDFEGRFNAD